MLVAQQPGGDDADELGEEEGGEGPAVEIEATQIGDDGGQHGGDGQRLKRNGDDGQHQAQGQGRPPPREGIGIRLLRGGWCLPFRGERGLVAGARNRSVHGCGG